LGVKLPSFSKLYVPPPFEIRIILMTFYIVLSFLLWVVSNGSH